MDVILAEAKFDNTMKKFNAQTATVSASLQSPTCFVFEFSSPTSITSAAATVGVYNHNYTEQVPLAGIIYLQTQRSAAQICTGQTSCKDTRCITQTSGDTSDLQVALGQRPVQF